MKTQIQKSREEDETSATAICNITLKISTINIVNPKMETQIQKFREEDETLTHIFHFNNDEQRLIFRVIGGYPASNGGLDSGNPKSPLFATGKLSLYLLTISLMGWQGRGCDGCSNDVGR